MDLGRVEGGRSLGEEAWRVGGEREKELGHVTPRLQPTSVRRIWLAGAMNL